MVACIKLIFRHFFFFENKDILNEKNDPLCVFLFASQYAPTEFLPVTNFINIFYLIFSLVYFYVLLVICKRMYAWHIRLLFVFLLMVSLFFFFVVVTFEHRYILHRYFR